MELLRLIQVGYKSRNDYILNVDETREMAIKVTVIMKGKMEKSSCSEDIICGQSPFQACDGVFVCAKTCEGQHML